MLGGGRGSPRKVAWVSLTWQLRPAHWGPAAQPPPAVPPAASPGWGPQGHPHCGVTGQHCDRGHPVTHPRHLPTVPSTHLKKETWGPYIAGLSCRGGYWPNGGTMRLKSRARPTKRAGSTIWGTRLSAPTPTHPTLLPLPWLLRHPRMVTRPL